MDLNLRLDSDTLVLDGSMSSMLADAGVPADANRSELNLLDPELIAHIHQRFILAGADCVTTNTQDASPLLLETAGIAEQMEAINQAGVQLAQQHRPQHILASVGPSGLWGARPDTPDTALASDSFHQQISVLAASQPDAILLDGFSSAAELKLAAQTARAACDLPLIATFTLVDAEHLPDASQAVEVAKDLSLAGMDAIGIADGPDMEVVISCLKAITAQISLPLYVKAPAILVNAATRRRYTATSNQAAVWAQAFHQVGASLIGFGRAADPSHCGAAYGTVSGLDRKLRWYLERNRLFS
jgi:homocysteine S-methyltransferase